MLLHIGLSALSGNIYQLEDSWPNCDVNDSLTFIEEQVMFSVVSVF